MDEATYPARKKPTRAKKIRTAVAVGVALACAGGFVYVRYGMAKSPLGGPCAYKVSCAADAPTCLKQTADGEGVCSRACDAGAFCAEGIPCIKVELDERDERGMPLEGGYCVPQAILDARKKKPEAGAARTADSWIDVPETKNQIEGDVELRWEGGHGPPRTTSVVVKGSLVRASGAAAASKKTRTIADASAMRVYVVDDEKRTFAASAFGGGGAGAEGPKVTKTNERDRVADHECEIWRIEEPRGHREVCVVQGGAFVDPSSRVVDAWLRELAVRAAFPVRMVERDASGKELAKMVATRLELHPVDASLFTVPRAYKNLAAR